MSLEDCNVCFDNSPKNDWFAFRVRPRHEKTVAVQLREKQQEYFLPVVREPRRWAKRLTHVDLPLFPGYIFCRTHRSAISPILRTVGIIDVLRSGSHLAPVEEGEITALKKAIHANARIETSPYVDIGEEVRINEGPLSGLSGFVVEVRNSQRLVLSLTILRRSVLVELNPESISRTDHVPAVLEFGQPLRCRRISHNHL